MNSEKLETLIGYKFKNNKLLLEALTHRSYINENPAWSLPHNERLEFLGDAVLELIVTEILFNQYPTTAEGQLTALRASLVNYQMLAEVARSLSLEKFLPLSKRDPKDTRRARDLILANATEATLRALSLDSGYPDVKEFITRWVMPRLSEVLEKGSYKDAKSLLQEKTQAQQKITPLYKVLEESGPDHKKLFTVGAYLNDDLVAKGRGFSKQDAEVEAAQEALKKLEE